MRGAPPGGSERRGGVLLVLLLAVLPLSAGCGDDGAAPAAGDAETVPRETFVATYVDLRLQVLRSGAEEIDPEARERILSRHGVTGDELLRFVEVHGDDVRLMNEIWTEVQTRIDSIRNAGDTASS